MPYISEAQRKFFHSAGAAKVGITPAMVAEWDDASRGLKLPERAKTASELLAQLTKAANLTQPLTPSRMTGIKPPAAMKPPKPFGAPAAPAALKPSDVSANLTPSGYQGPFRDNAGAGAQRASADMLHAGEALTMPG